MSRRWAESGRDWTVPGVLVTLLAALLTTASCVRPAPRPESLVCHPELYRAAYADILTELKAAKACPTASEQISAILESAIRAGRIPAAGVVVGSSKGIF